MRQPQHADCRCLDFAGCRVLARLFSRLAKVQSLPLLLTALQSVIFRWNVLPLFLLQKMSSPVLLSLLAARAVIRVTAAKKPQPLRKSKQLAYDAQPKSIRL